MSFYFTINNSFLKSTTHPITVPRSQVGHKKIEEEGFNQGDLTIIFPKGERVRGHMYHGVSGRGPYYQIRAHSRQDFPKYLSKGDEVIIILFKDRNNRYSGLEYIH
jgi:hypothetical protein